MKMDKRFIPIDDDREFWMQSNHFKKQKKGCGNSGKTNIHNSRKTPSPQKEVKLLQRRSPTNGVVGSPNAGTLVSVTPPSRLSPTRMSPKARVVAANKIANCQTQRCLDFSTNQAILDGDNYAGARFHSPPTPDALPKPPTHWMGASCATINRMYSPFHPDSIASHLKGLLNVQA